MIMGRHFVIHVHLNLNLTAVLGRVHNDDEILVNGEPPKRFKFMNPFGSTMNKKIAASETKKFQKAFHQHYSGSPFQRIKGCNEEQCYENGHQVYASPLPDMRK